MDSNQAPGPAWDPNRTISRQASAAPYTPPPMPVQAPPMGIFEELKMLEEMVAVVGKGLDHLGDRMSPVLTMTMPMAARDEEEPDTSDGYVVVQLRRMRSRMSDFVMKMNDLEKRLQLP